MEQRTNIKEFVPEKQTVNAEFYVGVLERLVKRIRRVHPKFHEPNSWMLLHDNTTSHTAIHTKHFLTEKGITTVEHPPYTPDLAPADFFLFPWIKYGLKGTQFSGISHIQGNVTMLLKAIPQTDFSASFMQLCQRCQKCIIVQGDYFEGK